MIARLLTLAILLIAGPAASQSLNYFGGGPATPAPWMQVATSTYVPTAIAGAGTTAMTHKAHVARDTINSLKLIYPAWYAQATKADISTANLPICAWVEYPQNTYVAVTFSGSTCPTLTGGSTTTSDATTISIPNGSTFWTWTWVNGLSPEEGAAGESLLKSGQSEGASIASSGVPTAPAASTLTGGANIAGLMPLVILAQTNVKSVVLFGDSRQYGKSDTTETGLDRGNTAPSLCPTLACANFGVEGDTTVAFLSSTNRRNLAQYFTIVDSGYGTNDMYLASGTAAGAEAWKRRETWDFLNKPYTASTVEPNTTSTDAWATTVNQTATAQDAIFTAYNGDLRSSAYAAYSDISDATSSARDSGLWSAPPACTPDGLHGNTTCMTAIVTSGNVNPTTIAALGISSYVLTPTVQSNSATYSTTAPKFGTGNLSGGNLAVYGTVAGVVPYTIEAWIKTSTAASNTAFGSAGNDSLALSANGFGTAVINGNTINGTITLNDNVWHYVVLAATSSSEHFCVDGVLSGSAAVAAGQVKASSNAMALGGLGRPTLAGTSAQWAGSVDEFAVFNYDKYAANSNACPAAPTNPYVGTESGLVSVMHLDSASAVVMGPAQ